ncbi:MAG: sigma-54 dependent transcriptional regulator [Calditrichia bacterium]
MNENGRPRILVLDDEKPVLNAIFRTLRRDYEVVLSSDGQSALQVLKDQPVSVILADQRMPGITGVEFFQQARTIQPNTVRILITGYTDIDATIEAVNKAKIYYYISKPWEPEELRLIVQRAVENHHLVRENQRLMEELKQANQRLQQENIILHREAEKQYEFDNIVGQSAAIQQVFRLMRKIIPTDTTVLLQGETGTGKELIARAIHYNGLRKNKLFVAQNCAALPDTLLESELFGHVKGAFTGASANKKGLFELADGGTIFLDEIADTSPAMQQRLLRVLQEEEIRPVGGSRNIRVNVRVISATNQDLQQAIAAGRFREDLFYRLNVFPIRIPPLRERREDIPLLAEHFLKKYSMKIKKSIPGFEPSALKQLTTRELPGNVRQLENIIERAVALGENGQRIRPEDLADGPSASGISRQVQLPEGESLREVVENMEQRMITAELRRQGGNITRTARELGLSRVGLQKKLKRYHINSGSIKKSSAEE